MQVRTVRIGIVVATFGEDRWYQLATKRAVPSADAQTFTDEDGVRRVRPSPALVHGRAL